jgi:hypothetical protein
MLYRRAGRFESKRLHVRNYMCAMQTYLFDSIFIYSLIPGRATKINDDFKATKEILGIPLTTLSSQLNDIEKVVRIMRLEQGKGDNSEAYVLAVSNLLELAESELAKLKEAYGRLKPAMIHSVLKHHGYDPDQQDIESWAAKVVKFLKDFSVAVEDRHKRIELKAKKERVKRAEEARNAKRSEQQLLHKLNTSIPTTMPPAEVAVASSIIPSKRRRGSFYGASPSQHSSSAFLSRLLPL